MYDQSFYKIFCGWSNFITTCKSHAIHKNSFDEHQLRIQLILTILFLLDYLYFLKFLRIYFSIKIHCNQ
jgi:hypothetical protein